MSWKNSTPVGPQPFTCGFCGKVVSSNNGFYGEGAAAQRRIFVCPNCEKPVYFEGEKQIPGVAPGTSVDHVPKDVDALYTEARNCIAASCYTSAVLACRKLLLHIAAAQGGTNLDNFVKAVDHLASTGWVPPNGKGWVDHIRKKGNEANHEIVLMSKSDAEDLVTFAEMLLKFIYEFPNRVPTAGGKTP